MGDINIGAIGGPVTGSAVGPDATVYNRVSATSIASAEDYLAEVEALRKSLQQASLQREAKQQAPDVTLDDAIAALAWLRQHYTDPSKPADADRRLTALKRLRKVWTPLVEMAKQLPAGLLAGWIVEAMN
ncbi:hypothetical protein [Micromonospora sp. DT47]|uniref:hypothetical protein n=1 Tax=Micromonospora sp. DT47 TaxID=3393431 RepID=UPI003CE85124